MPFPNLPHVFYWPDLTCPHVDSTVLLLTAALFFLCSAALLLCSCSCNSCLQDSGWQRAKTSQQVWIEFCSNLDEELIKLPGESMLESGKYVVHFVPQSAQSFQLAESSLFKTLTFQSSSNIFTINVTLLDHVTLQSAWQNPQSLPESYMQESKISTWVVMTGCQIAKDVRLSALFADTTESEWGTISWDEESKSKEDSKGNFAGYLPFLSPAVFACMNHGFSLSAPPRYDVPGFVENAGGLCCYMLPKFQRQFRSKRQLLFALLKRPAVHQL